MNGFQLWQPQRRLWDVVGWDSGRGAASGQQDLGPLSYFWKLPPDLPLPWCASRDALGESGLGFDAGVEGRLRPGLWPVGRTLMGRAQLLTVSCGGSAVLWGDVYPRPLRGDLFSGKPGVRVSLSVSV